MMGHVLDSKLGPSTILEKEPKKPKRKRHWILKKEIYCLV